MAKVTKSLKLPREIIAWLDQRERSTGVSQARTVLAALLSFMTEGRNHPLWVTLAVLLEKGEVDLETLIGVLRHPEAEQSLFSGGTLSAERIHLLHQTFVRRGPGKRSMKRNK